MAETAYILMPQDITSVVFKDNTGTPLQHPFKLSEGSIKIMDGFFNTLIAKAPTGIPESGAAPRQAGVGAFCGVEINGFLRDLGKDTTNTTYADLVRGEGVIASAPWVPTTTSPDATMDTWDIEVTIADRGTTKGGVFLFPDCRLEGAHEFSITNTGAQVAATWRSQTTPLYTFTRAT